MLSIEGNDSISTITKDDESELCNAIETLKKTGGTIYINTPVINMTSKCQIQLSGTLAGGIVGIKQSNGQYPSLNFKKARNENNKSPGIKITGSNQFVKYLISKNTVDHVIS